MEGLSFLGLRKTNVKSSKWDPNRFYIGHSIKNFNLGLDQNVESLSDGYDT